MKIVLLGASGQLGREWQHFFKAGRDNTILLPYTSAQLDVTDSKRLTEELQKERPDAVINCAAYTNVDGAEEERSLARKVNTEAVANLADLANELDFKLVHYSTDYVFAGRIEDRDQFPEGYPEDHSADPINYYGQTKWEGEQAIREEAEDHLIIRVSWLCGAYGSNFVKTMLRLGREREELQVVNDQWGSPSFTDNVVQNTWTLLQAGAAGTFNITSEGFISWYDFAKAIFEKEGINVEVKAVSSDQFPTKAERPSFSKLNTQKLKAVSTASPEDWSAGLERLLGQL